jgi:hypothetical protein
MRYARGAAHWVRRHAFAALAATVIAVGAAGGGIGYAVASQHPVAPASTTPTTNKVPSSAAPGGHHGSASARLFQRALNLIATQTGQSVATVRSELAAGKSVNDIAGSKAAAIESSILAQVTKLADHAVAAGKLSSTAEASLLAAARTKLEALMAEPGTQLLAAARNALTFVPPHAGKHTAPTPSPAP